MKRTITAICVCALLAALALAQLPKPGGGGGGSNSVASMTLAAFDTETTTGTLNPQARTLIALTESVYSHAAWNGSAWQYWADGQRITGRPPSSGWSCINCGGSDSVAYYRGAIRLTAYNTSGDNFVLAVRTAPVVPYTVNLALRATSDIGNIGGALRQSSDGKFVRYAATNSQIIADLWTNPTTYGGVAYRTLNTWAGGGFGRLFWMQLADDNTNRIGRISNIPESFITIHSGSRTANSTTANQVGFLAYTKSTVYGTAGTVPYVVDLIDYSEQ